MPICFTKRCLLGLCSVAALVNVRAQGDGVCKAADGGTCPEEQDIAELEDGVYQDMKLQCPFVDTPLRHVISKLFHGLAASTRIAQMLSIWPSGISPEGWADAYTVIGYLFVAQVSLGLYSTRDSTYVKVPQSQLDRSDVIHVENIYAPHFDVDGFPNFYWFEKYIPKFLMDTLYLPFLTCFYAGMRRLGTDTLELNGTFDDVLSDPWENTWAAVLQNSTFQSKRDWVWNFFENTRTWDGRRFWPEQMTDFRMYFKQDEWGDELEFAMAFHLIGTHRLESGSWSFENLPGIGEVTLPFRIALNVFSAFEVRDHFGRYGADLYFNEDGLPVLIKTPMGQTVLRGEKEWQYWKFVWRSTLITGITLVDHLHLAHFRTANLLARVTRISLPPAHPLRRISAVFTFGSIFVNVQAMHTLTGPNQMLHRATPFKEFTKISKVVPDEGTGILADTIDIPAIKTLYHDAEWAKLHPKLKEAPFYADGRLLMAAFKKMTKRMVDVVWKFECQANGTLGEHFKLLSKEILTAVHEAHYALNKSITQFIPKIRQDCRGEDIKIIMIERLVSYYFIATGWHRHVGFVGDYYLDPTLATMSWKNGEAFGRPKQHIIMTLINVFTSTLQPKLNEDYTHLFKGMVPDVEKEFVDLWRSFQSDLADMEVEIDKRNSQRKIVNINMSPKVLESAVSK